jgi:chitodextrinase
MRERILSLMELELSEGVAELLPVLRIAFATAVLFVALLFGTAPARAADPMIAVAGDISCSTHASECGPPPSGTPWAHQMQTSDLLVNGGYAKVLVLGDNQYNSGSLSDYQNYYDPSWGRVKSITLPTPGNHDRCPETGYDEYFGYACWYYKDVGTWRVISLDSDNPTDPSQLAMLDTALQGTSGCILAFWHHARFSSGHDGDNTFMQPIYQKLYDAQADVILSGHSHNYERFAPMDATGKLDPSRGIREFVVGTGGAFFTGLSNIRPNSEARQNNTFGILKMTLHPDSYDWEFVPEAGKTYTDSGSSNCHRGSPGPGPDTQAPSVPANLTATPASSFQVNLSWVASNDNVGVTGYEIYRDGALLTTRTGTTYSDTTVVPGQSYSYRVRALDAAGNRSAFGNTATATPPIPDTEAPASPANLAADATGPFNVNVSWDASSDNVGVTGYEIYRDGALLTTKTTTTHSDTTVVPGRIYSYEVRALDAAGNRSAFSAPATARPVDTQAPAAPANLAASAPSSSQVNLTWSAAGDDVGVTGYEVFRNGAYLAAAAGTGYTDSTVSFSVTNSYQVRALDGAGNRSGFGNSAPVVITVKASPEADAQVVEASPSANYGTSTLRTDGGSDPDIESYLKFTLSGLPGPVQSAKLRVYAYSGTADGPAAFGTATGWSENAVTWASRPAVTSGAVDDRAAISPSSWAEYNVASLIAGNGTYGFRLAQTSTDGIDFRSREHTDSTLRPQLVVTTIQTGPPPPPPPPPGPGPSPPGPGGSPGSPLNPSGPFSPIGSADTVAPKLTLGGPKSQRLAGGALALTARCDEQCTVTASAKLKIGRSSGLFKSSRASQALAAGKDATLRLRFSSRSLRSIRRALARGRRVLAKVTVRSNDAAGNVGSARATIRLKR